MYPMAIKMHSFKLMMSNRDIEMWGKRIDKHLASINVFILHRQNMRHKTSIFCSPICISGRSKSNRSTVIEQMNEKTNQKHQCLEFVFACTSKTCCCCFLSFLLKVRLSYVRFYYKLFDMFLVGAFFSFVHLLNFASLSMCPHRKFVVLFSCDPKNPATHAYTHSTYANLHSAPKKINLHEKKLFFSRPNKPTEKHFFHLFSLIFSVQNVVVCINIIIC